MLWMNPIYHMLALCIGSVHFGGVSFLGDPPLRRHPFGTWSACWRPCGNSLFSSCRVNRWTPGGCQVLPEIRTSKCTKNDRNTWNMLDLSSKICRGFMGWGEFSMAWLELFKGFINQQTIPGRGYNHHFEEVNHRIKRAKGSMAVNFSPEVASDSLFSHWCWKFTLAKNSYSMLQLQ